MDEEIFKCIESSNISDFEFLWKTADMDGEFSKETFLKRYREVISKIYQKLKNNSADFHAFFSANFLDYDVQLKQAAAELNTTPKELEAHRKSVGSTTREYMNWRREKSAKIIGIAADYEEIDKLIENKHALRIPNYVILLMLEQTRNPEYISKWLNRKQEIGIDLIDTIYLFDVIDRLRNSRNNERINTQNYEFGEN